MATLRPTKDLRSISVNEFSTTSTKSKRPIPTPFLRQPSVVEVLEKKQREGLKNRLKMLHTGAVLPSRKPVSKTLPVIVKEPVRRMTLPKNPPRKAAHYRSVLTLAAEPEGDPTTASHMTRRHSVGGLICTYGSKERLSSDSSNGIDFKSQTLPPGLSGLSSYKYGSTNADSRHKSDPADTRPKSRLPTAKDDNYLNKNSSSSSIGSFQPISKTQSQILTNIAERNEFKDAKTKGNYRRHDTEDEEEVFSSPRTKVDLDENFNVKVQNKANDRGLKDITDKPDTSYLVNGHKDVTTKIKLDSDIVVTMKTMPLTNSTRPRSTDEFLMTELRSEGTGGTHPNKDKEQPRSMLNAGLESSTLLDFDDSFSTTPSHKYDKNDESLLEKSLQQHTLATTAHTTYPDFEKSNQEHTGAFVTSGKVVVSKKLEPEIPDGSQFSDDAFFKIKVLTATSGNHDFPDDLKELKKNDDKGKDETDDFWSTFDKSFTGPVKTTTTTSNNSELIDIEFQKSPHAALDNYHSSGKEKDTSKPSDALWSTFEDSFTGSVQSTSSKSYSEPVDADVLKRWDTGLGKHNFSDDLKELIKSDNVSNGESDSGFQWSGNDDSLTSTIETASSIKSRSESIEGKFHDSPDVNHGRSYFSDDLKETNKNDDKSEGKGNTLWPSTEDSLASSVQTILSSSPTEVGIEKKRPDSGLSKHNISDDSKELKKIDDDKGKDKLDGHRSGVEHSYTAGQPTTTAATTKATTTTATTTTTTTTSKQCRSELIEVEVQKCPDAGLGFCIEGGKESALGDRPVTVKRVFNAATQRCLKEGDEILTVCGKETSTLTRIDAWKLFKSLPDGSVKMTIIRRME